MYKRHVQEIVLPDVLEEETAEHTEETLTEETEEEKEKEEQEEHLPEDWNLILVNRTHPIPEDYEVELKNIGSGHQIDARAYDDFRAMIQAAKSEGVYIYVTSVSYTHLVKLIMKKAKNKGVLSSDYKDILKSLEEE